MSLESNSDAVSPLLFHTALPRPQYRVVAVSVPTPTRTRTVTPGGEGEPIWEVVREVGAFVFESPAGLPAQLPIHHALVVLYLSYLAHRRR